MTELPLKLPVNFFKKLLTIFSYHSKIPYVSGIQILFARVAQLVEHDLAKVGVAGSSPVSRSLANKKGHPMDVLFC